MINIRVFKDSGIQLMEKYLDSLTTDFPLEYPNNILYDSAHTELLAPEVETENRKFTNRYEVGEYFYNIFNDSAIENIDRMIGLWSWLALYYFDEFCATDSDGKMKPGERARWIPAVRDYKKYYRHLLAGPYRIYKTHRDNPKRAFALLCTSPDRPGEVVEQLSSRQELVTNSSIMEVATSLYVNKNNGVHKKGASGKGPGSARRLADVFFQFDLTWDLYSMTSEEIINILPIEFKKYIDN